MCPPSPGQSLLHLRPAKWPSGTRAIEGRDSDSKDEEALSWFRAERSGRVKGGTLSSIENPDQTAGPDSLNHKMNTKMPNQLERVFAPCSGGHGGDGGSFPPTCPLGFAVFGFRVNCILPPCWQHSKPKRHLSFALGLNVQQRR